MFYNIIIILFSDTTTPYYIHCRWSYTIYLYNDMMFGHITFWRLRFECLFCSYLYPCLCVMIMDTSTQLHYVYIIILYFMRSFFFLNLFLPRLPRFETFEYLNVMHCKNNIYRTKRSKKKKKKLFRKKNDHSYPQARREESAIAKCRVRSVEYYFYSITMYLPQPTRVYYIIII